MNVRIKYPTHHSPSPSSRRTPGPILILHTSKMDDALLPRIVLRAIRNANVRSGILPPQSGVRRDDEQRIKGRSR